MNQTTNPHIRVQHVGQGIRELNNFLYNGESLTARLRAPWRDEMGALYRDAEKCCYLLGIHSQFAKRQFFVLEQGGFVRRPPLPIDFTLESFHPRNAYRPTVPDYYEIDSGPEDESEPDLDGMNLGTDDDDDDNGNGGEPKKDEQKRKGLQMTSPDQSKESQATASKLQKLHDAREERRDEIATAGTAGPIAQPSRGSSEATSGIAGSIAQPTGGPSEANAGTARPIAQPPASQPVSMGPTAVGTFWMNHPTGDDPTYSVKIPLLHENESETSD
jgi:hypothetical protein